MNCSAEWIFRVKYRWKMGEEAVVGFLKHVQWWGILGHLRGADMFY